MRNDEWVEVKDKEELPEEDGLYLVKIEDVKGQNHLGAIYKDNGWASYAGPCGRIRAWCYRGRWGWKIL